MSGVGIIRSEVFQEGQQLVVRAVPCFFDAEGRSARERFFLQTHICVEIHLCCLHGFVPQPEGYHGAVNAMLQKVHGGAVPKGVRGDLLPFERRASLFGNIGVLGDEALDQSTTTNTGEDRVFGKTVAFA